MSRRPHPIVLLRRRPRAALLLGIVLLTLCAASAEARKGPRQGDPMVVTGRIADATGVPLAGVTVLLEMAHAKLQLRTLKRAPHNVLQLAAVTDASGDYRLEWSWDRYYDSFAVVVVLADRDADGTTRHEEFARRDVTADVLASPRGAAVSAPVTVAQASVLRWVSRFATEEPTEDERRIFTEMGRPDRVDTAPTDAGEESSWWYFEAGKVYRFEDRALVQVTHFEPIEPL